MSQRKTNTLRFHLRVESKEQHKRMSKIEADSCNLDAFAVSCSGISHLVRNWPGCIQRALGWGLLKASGCLFQRFPGWHNLTCSSETLRNSPFSWASLHSEAAKVRQGLGEKGERDGKGKTKSKQKGRGRQEGRKGGNRRKKGEYNLMSQSRS